MSKGSGGGGGSGGNKGTPLSGGIETFNKINSVKDVGGG